MSNQEALSVRQLDKYHEATAEVITAVASAYCPARLQFHATKGQKLFTKST